MSYGAKTYKKTAITTASREKILLMLYEALIKNLKIAKKAIDEKNIPEKCKHITKAHDILLELSNSLDHSKGPEVSEQLEGLYSYSISQLLHANLNSDAAAIESVLKVMTTLYEGWVIAVEEAKKGAPKNENR
jgi:flagellar secretion chaperone FliS